MNEMVVWNYIECGDFGIDGKGFEVESDTQISFGGKKCWNLLNKHDT